MFSKFIKSRMSLVEQESKKNTHSFSFGRTDLEGLDEWLYNREERSIRQFDSNVTLDNVNSLTGRDGWDDNLVHTEGDF